MIKMQRSKKGHKKSYPAIMCECSPIMVVTTICRLLGPRELISASVKPTFQLYSASPILNRVTDGECMYLVRYAI